MPKPAPSMPVGIVLRFLTEMQTAAAEINELVHGSRRPRPGRPYEPKCLQDQAVDSSSTQQ